MHHMYFFYRILDEDDDIIPEQNEIEHRHNNQQFNYYAGVAQINQIIRQYYN